MIRIALLAGLMMMSPISAGSAAAAGHEAQSPSGIAPHEVYIRLYPRDGYVVFREYNVSTPLAADSEIRAQVGHIRDLVGGTQFAETEYGFRFFRLREERFYEDDGFLTGEHHLTTEEGNLKTLMEDSFGRILRRDVEVTITETDINLHFDRTGLVGVASTNAESTLGRESDLRTIISWRNGVPFYEAVFIYEWDENRYRPLLPNFGGDLTSPSR